MSATKPPPVEPVTCLKCGESMRLTRIEPEGPNEDLRMYECACGHSETQHVTYK